MAGEPQVDQAISFEEKADAAKGEAPEPELVSRETQAGLGLLTGVVTYGAAFGGLFSLVFAYAYGRVRHAECARVVRVAGACRVHRAGDRAEYQVSGESTFGGRPRDDRHAHRPVLPDDRDSIAAMVFSLKVRRRAAPQLGAWNGSIVAGAVFVAIIAAVQLPMPTINEVPAAFPAVLLWKFRVAAIGMQAVMWTTIGCCSGSRWNRCFRPLQNVAWTRIGPDVQCSA